MQYDFDTPIDRTHTWSIKHDFKKENGKADDILPLWVADMDFRSPDSVVEALKKAVDHGIFGYSRADESYFDAVAAWYQKPHPLTLQPEWMTCTPGIVFALSIAVRAFTQEGDAVLIQPPVYHPFSRAILRNKRTLVENPLVLKDGHYEMDLEDLEYVMGTLKLLGSKGTTGTQASFLELFDGDQETIDKIDPMIAEKMGFKSCYPVSGQTYSRKVDTRVLNVLAGIAASAHKMSNDIRLLQHLKEVEEPFEKNQIGSSAMAYKRNPMRSERIASLSRYVMVDALNPAITSATQWFERTLDDSANKRLSVPEGFLAIDGILDLCLNVVDGLVVYPKVIYKHFMAEIPFMATENIMMDAVKEGGNRQELHEKIRQLSMQAGKTVKEEGKDNNLVDLIAADPAFGLTKEQIEANLKPELYVGRAPRQVEVFLRDVVRPVLDAHKEELGVTAEINV